MDDLQQYVDLVIQHGTDRYGETHAPILVSVLDLESSVKGVSPMFHDFLARRGPKG